MSILSLKVEKPRFTLLTEGEHIVFLSDFHELTSADNYNGTPSERAKPWENPAEQLGLTLVGKEGVIVSRINLNGFKRFNELTDAEIKTGKYQDIDGYACFTQKGKLYRETCERRQEDCRNILNQFTSALKLEEGAEIGEQLALARDEKREFKIEVVNDPFNGKDHMKVSKWMAIRSSVKQTAEAEMED